MYLYMCTHTCLHISAHSVFMFADGAKVDEVSVSRFRVTTAKKTVTVQVRRILVFDWLALPVQRYLCRDWLSEAMSVFVIGCLKQCLCFDWLSFLLGWFLVCDSYFFVSARYVYVH